MSIFRRCLAALLPLALAACVPAPRPVFLDPPPPPAGTRVLPDDGGRASFFVPVDVPLAELRAQAEAGMPRQIEERATEEYAPLLDGEAWRLLATRGGISAGFSADRFVFRFPVEGRLTFSGRLRPLGLPVRESIDFSGVVTGSVKPDLAPDWHLALETHARLDLSRAEVRIFKIVTVSLRGLVQEEIDPLLEREFRRAAERAVAGWKLRERASAAWQALHVSQEVGDGLRLRFRPEEVRVAPLRAEGDRVRTGFAVAGPVHLGFPRGEEPPPPPVPLPPPGVLDEPAGRIEIDVPVVATEEDLARLAARRLQGKKPRVGGAGMTITGTSLRVLGDRLLVALDVKTRGAEGRLFLRGTPVFDAQEKVLRLAGLDYDLATRSRLLKVADWLLRDDVLAALEKETRFDVAATLREADLKAQEALGSLRLPAGFQGEIRLDAATVTELVVADGYLWVRCRITGTSTPLIWSGGP